MTSAVAGRAIRTGAVTQAERDTLARKVAQAQAKQRPAAAAPPASSPPAQAQPAPAQKPAVRPAPARPAPKPAPAPRRAPGRLQAAWAGTETVGQSAAGLILGLLVWGWIVLPLVRGGPDEVRDTLRAKFVNKDPEGRWLP